MRLGVYTARLNSHKGFTQGRLSVACEYRKGQSGAMKQDTHPDYHFIEVVMTNGTRFKTRSTYGKKGDVLQLDVDPTSHPAWTGGSQTLVDRAGRVSRFKDKFKGFGV